MLKQNATVSVKYGGGHAVVYGYVGPIMPRNGSPDLIMKFYILLLKISHYFLCPL